MNTNNPFKSDSASRRGLIQSLVCAKTALFKAMQYPSVFIFSSSFPLGFLPCAGLRLGALRQFQAFLASSPFVACASSYSFASIALPPWRCAFSRFAPVVNLGCPILSSGSNRSVKPTRLRRVAYFRSFFTKECYEI